MAAWLIVAVACGDDATDPSGQDDASGMHPADAAHAPREGGPRDAGRDASPGHDGAAVVDASAVTDAAIDSSIGGIDATVLDAGAADAGSDAGTAMPDAGPPDAGTDAGPACPSGEMLCDGTCVDTDSHPDHCGDCGTVCPSRPEAARTCVAGGCSYECQPAWTDCDGEAGNGCEVRTRSDESNCGGCGIVCGPYQECSAGRCEELPYGLDSHTSTPCTLSDPPATNLSATRCYADIARREAAEGLIPYSVTSPLWSDGTHKRRYLYVPPSGRIGYTDYGVWDLPVGTILVKELRINTVEGDASSEITLETRFWVRRASGWDGYLYKWNDAQTDATRYSGGRDDYTITQSDGSTDTYTHWFPNADECAFCHNGANGVSIGMRTLQMNRDYPYSMATDNQLRTLEHIGVLSALPTTPDALPSMPEPFDTSAPRAERARSYLQGNCAHCHFPGGPSDRSIDLRFETSFGSTNTCGVVPEGSDLGISDARIIDPGSPSTSVLYLRANRRGWSQMPIVGTLEVDSDGTSLLRSWIAGLSGCP